MQRKQVCVQQRMVRSTAKLTLGRDFSGFGNDLTREVREVTRSFSQTKRRVFRYWSKSSKTAFNFFGVHLWSSGDQRSILAVAMCFAAFALFSTVGLAEWSMALVRRRDFSECQVRLLPSELFCLFIFFTFFLMFSCLNWRKLKTLLQFPCQVGNCNEMPFIVCARCASTLCWEHFVIAFHYC